MIAERGAEMVLEDAGVGVAAAVLTPGEVVA
jgi:hypothetical protein